MGDLKASLSANYGGQGVSRGNVVAGCIDVATESNSHAFKEGHHFGNVDDIDTSTHASKYTTSRREDDFLQAVSFVTEVV